MKEDLKYAYGTSYMDKFLYLGTKYKGSTVYDFAVTVCNEAFSSD
jgi:hypothetical protein